MTGKERMATKLPKNQAAQQRHRSEHKAKPKCSHILGHFLFERPEQGDDRQRKDGDHRNARGPQALVNFAIWSFVFPQALVNFAIWSFVFAGLQGRTVRSNNSHQDQRQQEWCVEKPTGIINTVIDG